MPEIALERLARFWLAAREPKYLLSCNLHSLMAGTCSATHTSGFRFAFLLTRSGAKELLVSVLAAQTTGRNVQIVGTGECTIDPSLEDLSYVVLMP